MADVSIVIKGKDELSNVLRDIQKAQTNYRKDVDSLNRELNELTENHGRLSSELTAAKKALQEAQKQFRATGDEADGMNVALKQMDVDNISRNMRTVSNAMKSTERDMQSLTASAKKMDNQLSATGGAGAGGTTGLAAAVKSLAAAGLGNMLGSSIGGLAGALTTSAFGSTTGNMVNSTLSSAVTGAAMGSILGPVGTAVGGLVGAISGAISGLTQAQEKVDESYRTYVQESYSSATEALQSAVTGGSETAASREMYGISFRATMGEEAGQLFYENLKEYAETTPFEFDPLIEVSQALMPGFGDDAEHMLSVLQTVGDAASALGKSESDMAEMARALSRMETTDKTTLEYLNLLTERGIDAIDYLGTALGGENGPLTTAQVYDMISEGKIAGTDAVQIIMEGLQQDYAGATEQASNTYTGKTANLEDAWANIYNAAGEGYNEVRMAGIDEELAWLDENGERLQEMYRQYGEYQAEMDNAQGKAKLAAYEDAINALDRRNEMMNAYNDALAISQTAMENTGTMAQGITGKLTQGIAGMMDDFKLSATGASTYGLLGQAIMEGDAAFYSSDVYSEFVNENVDMINAIQGDPTVASAAMNSGYYIAEELTKGVAAGVGQKIGAAISAGMAESSVNAVTAPSEHMKSWNASAAGYYDVGLPEVPYDDFPAYLHKGERVLTAAEAAAYNAGYGGGGVTITGNTFVVREEADVEKIAAAIARKLSNTARSYAG